MNAARSPKGAVLIDPTQLSTELKRKIEIKEKRIQELELALPQLENFEKLEGSLKQEVATLGAELSELLLRRFNNKEKIFTDQLTRVLRKELERLQPEEEEEPEDNKEGTAQAGDKDKKQKAGDKSKAGKKA